MRGTVRLHDADLRHAPWNLAFDKANGPLRFSQAGFSADELAVLADGDPASLSIAQGEFVVAPAHSLEASLRGELPVSTLVRDYPMLAPFTGLMPGRSAWTVELAIDKVEGDVVAPKHLVLRSDLVGTAIDLPAPLRKDADSAMPARIALDLPGSVGNAIGRNTVEINQGNVRSAAIAQSGDRTRLVLNLRQASNYRAELQGNALLIILESPQTASAAVAAGGAEPVHFAPSQNAQVSGLREVDFRRFLQLSGDAAADMAAIAQGFEACTGRNPQQASPIRLKP